MLCRMTWFKDQHAYQDAGGSFLRDTMSTLGASQQAPSLSLKMFSFDRQRDREGDCPTAETLSRWQQKRGLDQPGASFKFPTWVAGTRAWAISSCLPRYTSRELDRKLSSLDWNWRSDNKGCWLCRGVFTHCTTALAPRTLDRCDELEASVGSCQVWTSMLIVAKVSLMSPMPQV